MLIGIGREAGNRKWGGYIRENVLCFTTLVDLDLAATFLFDDSGAMNKLRPVLLENLFSTLGM